MAGNDELLKPFARNRGEGKSYWYNGNLMTFMLSGEESRGGLSITDVYFRTGEEPPMHVHHREDELYYVLDGELTFYVGDESHEAQAGTLVFLPRDIPHSFWVKGQGMARMLLLWYPSGQLESYFGEAGELAKEAVIPPYSGPPDEETVARWSQLLENYGIEVVGPPPSLPGGPQVRGPG